MQVVSKLQALTHYVWGTNCDGWNLVEEAGLSVKLEKMPPGTEEQSHYHRNAQQFFFILKGEALFEMDKKSFTLHANEGIHVLPNVIHRIVNAGQTDLEFLLCSQPATANDRIVC